MLELNGKQLLVLILTVLIAYPSPLISGTTVTAPPRSILGSITSSGSVRVGEVAVPSAGTLFAGDQVQTDMGSALIQYKMGSRVLLASQSAASFTPSTIQLQRGRMTFEVPNRGPVVTLSTLRLEPIGAKNAANVSLENSKANIAVTEGAVKIVDPSGVQLASLRAGEARLFEEASAASPAPAPSPAAAAAPQGSSNGAHWLLVGVALAGASLGIAGLIQASNAEDRADEAQTQAETASAAAASAQALANTLQASNAALTAQVNTLRTTVTTLQANLATLSLSFSQEQALIQQMSASLAALNTLESQLSSIQNQVTQTLAAIAQQGGTATSAQLSTLQSLGVQQNALFAQLQTVTNQVNQLLQQIQQIPKVSPFTP